jgi:predicted DNA-binding transcriptional regulator AlpA
MRYLTFLDLQHPKPSDGRPAVPYSRVHLKRLIREGKFPAPVKFGGPKSRDHWADDEIDAHYAALKTKSEAA